MKSTTVRNLLALLALSSTLVLPAAEYPLQAVAARIEANGSDVTAGTPRIMVALRLGTPNAVLPDGSWLYSGYSAQRREKQLVANGTLVVRFVDGRVNSLSVADALTVTALRQSPRSRVANPTLTAANDRR